MSTREAVAVGIEATSGEGGLGLAALDDELHVLDLEDLELEQALEYLRTRDSVFVAVTAPSRPSMGVIRRRKAEAHAHSRGADIREAESDLHERGIAVAATPGREAQCPAWVQFAFSLYRRLEALGFQPFPTEETGRQWLEVHPHAAFCALLGRLPLPNPSLEGRLQRALVLFEHGVRLGDPMEFFEEITRHRLLVGDLPMDVIPRPSHLDALVAAYTAWMALTNSQDVSLLGNSDEGHIVLPIRRLLPSY